MVMVTGARAAALGALLFRALVVFCVLCVMAGLGRVLLTRLVGLGF
jgi:hypothetical protein